MENQPTDGDDEDAQPKARGDEGMRDAVPIVDIKVFVGLAEKVKQRPCQNGSNSIDN
jgi:hypothetical protein